MAEMETLDRDGVRGYLHRPEGPLRGGLALTHGASSNANAPLLVAAARAFQAAGFLVLRYDLPYRQERRTGPPHPSRAPRDREGIVKAVGILRGLGAAKIIAAGHSYGGRQTTMAAAENAALAELLLLFSYPLHAPGRPEAPRMSHFPKLNAPCVFIHGSKDPFGTIEEMRAAIALIPSPVRLIEIAGSGHDLRRRGAFPIAEALEVVEAAWK